VARRYAITAVGNAILDLLRDSLPKDEFGTLPFPLLQSVDLQKGLTGEGVGLYLYRIGVNGTRRNLPPRVDANGKRYRPSLPLDLYYLLVPWAASAERQQLLLGWAMRTLENTPILPAGLLNQHGPRHDIFAANETVELVCDPLNLQDLQNVWEGLKPSVPLTVAYVARMVALDSDVEMVDAPPVQSRGFDHGKGPLL
jgi:Pvc16 N-terminal domain